MIKNVTNCNVSLFSRNLYKFQMEMAMLTTSAAELERKKSELAQLLARRSEWVAAQERALVRQRELERLLGLSASPVPANTYAFLHVANELRVVADTDWRVAYRVVENAERIAANKKEELKRLQEQAEVCMRICAYVLVCMEAAIQR